MDYSANANSRNDSSQELVPPATADNDAWADDGRWCPPRNELLQTEPALATTINASREISATILAELNRFQILFHRFDVEHARQVARHTAEIRALFMFVIAASIFVMAINIAVAGAITGLR